VCVKQSSHESIICFCAFCRLLSLGYTTYEIAEAILITCEARREWILSLQNKSWDNYFAIAERATRNLKKMMGKAPSSRNLMKMMGKDPQRAATKRDSNKVASPSSNNKYEIVLLLSITSAKDLDAWALKCSQRHDQEKRVSAGKGRIVST
jgi:hypothetical protein